MKRFKLIFHICYVIITMLVFYISVDVLINTEEYLSRIKFSSYVKFPRYVMMVFLLISLFMMAEFIIEKFSMFKMRDNLSKREDEILHLKAKLYDRSQEAQEIERESLEKDDYEEKDE